MMSCLDKNNKHFDYQYQNIIIVKELHNCFCEMYLGVKKTIFYDESFIVTNIRTDCQMDAADFEGLSYTTFSENPFNKQKINIKDSEYDFTITDYVSQH